MENSPHLFEPQVKPIFLINLILSVQTMSLKFKS
jgi:hypothetical protein